MPVSGRTRRSIHMNDIKTRMVVCLGASIVQGVVSSNFVDLLSDRMGDAGFIFVNRGVAGYQSYNILAGLDTIIELQPDFVVILVGTNDVTAALNPEISRLARLTNRTPQPPSKQFYYDNMLRIVRTLKEKTSAKIAIASIPVLGEDLESVSNRLIREYNTLIKEISTEEQAGYLSVYERQAEYLKANLNTAGRPFKGGIISSIELLVRHFIFGQSFDVISAKKGYLLVTDGMHLNSHGAAIIADEVEYFLRNSIQI
jgi:lysophospholipase L1-like esterase